MARRAQATKTRNTTSTTCLNAAQKVRTIPAAMIHLLETQHPPSGSKGDKKPIGERQKHRLEVEAWHTLSATMMAALSKTEETQGTLLAQRDQCGWGADTPEAVAAWITQQFNQHHLPVIEEVQALYRQDLLEADTQLAVLKTIQAREAKEAAYYWAETRLIRNERLTLQIEANQGKQGYIQAFYKLLNTELSQNRGNHRTDNQDRR